MFLNMLCTRRRFPQNNESYCIFGVQDPYTSDLQNPVESYISQTFRRSSAPLLSYAEAYQRRLRVAVAVRPVCPLCKHSSPSRIALAPLASMHRLCRFIRSPIANIHRRRQALRSLFTDIHRRSCSLCQPPAYIHHHCGSLRAWLQILITANPAPFAHRKCPSSSRHASPTAKGYPSPPLLASPAALGIMPHTPARSSRQLQISLFGLSVRHSQIYPAVSARFARLSPIFSMFRHAARLNTIAVLAGSARRFCNSSPFRLDSLAVRRCPSPHQHFVGSSPRRA